MSILAEVIVSALFSLLMSTGEEVKSEVSEKETTEIISEVDDMTQC